MFFAHPSWERTGSVCIIPLYSVFARPLHPLSLPASISYLRIPLCSFEEEVLFIGTQFSILSTAVDTSAAAACNVYLHPYALSPLESRCFLRKRMYAAGAACRLTSLHAH